MKYRTVVIHAEENLGTSGTKIIPIRVRDPITSLDLITRLTIGGAKRLAPYPSVISKLEIVDGSDVLLSLSGTEIIALSVLEGHLLVNGCATNLQDSTRTFRFRINFGRFDRDPILVFDPTKFLNPQLKITYDCTTVEANATPFYVAVVAECFDEKVISPVGFLRMTEYHSYVGTADTFAYIDLPVDLDIRKLYLQTKNFGRGVPENLHSVKLSEDNDKRVPFDLEAEQWSHKEAMEFGSAEQLIFATCGGFTDDPFYHIAGDQEVVFGTCTAVQQAIIAQTQSGCGGSFVGADTTAIVTGVAKGHIPYLVHCYAFGDQMDIDDWYKLAGKVESLRFRIKAGAQGDDVTFNTILQQLRRY